MNVPHGFNNEWSLIFFPNLLFCHSFKQKLMPYHQRLIGEIKHTIMSTCVETEQAVHTQKRKVQQGQILYFAIEQDQPETEGQCWCFSWIHGRDTPTNCMALLLPTLRTSGVFLVLLPIKSGRPSFSWHQGVSPDTDPLVLNCQVVLHILQWQCINSGTFRYICYLKLICRHLLNN